MTTLSILSCVKTATPITTSRYKPTKHSHTRATLFEYFEGNSDVRIAHTDFCMDFKLLGLKMQS